MKDILLAIICALITSSGFWALMWKQIDKKDNKSKLLIGLGHDRIMTLGIQYIERGYITTDEYENLNKYLYQPYKEAGGIRDGSTTRVMDEVNKLPIHDVSLNRSDLNG